MPQLALNRLSNGKRLVVRMCSPRLTIINAKNHQIMRTIDFASHDAAVFFAQQM